MIRNRTVRLLILIAAIAALIFGGFFYRPTSYTPDPNAQLERMARIAKHEGVWDLAKAKEFILTNPYRRSRFVLKGGETITLGDFLCLVQQLDLESEEQRMEVRAWQESHRDHWE